MFYRRGIVKEWVRGILKMAELATSSRLPSPGILDLGACMAMYLRHGWSVPSQQRMSDFSEPQQAIPEMLDQSN